MWSMTICCIYICLYICMYLKHLHPKNWRVVPSSTSRRSSSNAPHRKQTAPEEERLAQRSISLSESTQYQLPGLSSNAPLLWADFHSPMGQATPYPNSHHTSWQENVAITAETFRNKPLPPFPQRTSKWFGSSWNRGRRCRFGSPQPRLPRPRVACSHVHP